MTAVVNPASSPDPRTRHIAKEVPLPLYIKYIHIVYNLNTLVKRYFCNFNFCTASPLH